MSEPFAARSAEIIAALERVGAKGPCPRCGNAQFTLLDGYFNQPVQNQLGGMVLGGPSVPSVVAVCTRCGYLSQHALGALGLLPKPPSSPAAPPAARGQK